MPERNQNVDSPAVLLESAGHHRKILFSLGEKEIRRAQNENSKEYFSVVVRAERATAGLASLVGVLLKECSNFVQKTPPFDALRLLMALPWGAKGGECPERSPESVEGRSRRARFRTFAMEIWSVYILRCCDDSLYVGISNNVEERVKRHNAGMGAAYTRSHRPVILLWTEPAESESAARKREAQIKGWTRNKKLNLIQFGNPNVNP